MKKSAGEMSDAWDELDGIITLRFEDAAEGTPIEGAQVKIAGVGTFSTDEEGKVQFPAEKDGEPMEDETLPAKFSAPGYITAKFMVRVTYGTIFQNHFSMSKELPLGHMRVVLDWGNKPNDLDAHFIKEDGYHISFQDTRVAEDGSVVLDRDAKNGNGPETITIMDIDPSATYYYFVHDFSNKFKKTSDALSKSRGTVRVFNENQLLQTLEVPTGQIGNTWVLFRIVDGEIVWANQLMNN
ncbi:hypothetical protein GCM10023331_12870 [Algivirga pacifica]|uniref:Carboxypeptidase regulatory-like domain-containing protein n=2 Tax=Algivirga pacifica TaxID=1162670 RepID=A0ABP9D4L2_9BACT